jgi:magnesium-transporting ATPase (P-type)
VIETPRRAPAATPPGGPSQGLSTAEAQRRLLQFGSNELTRIGGRRWPRELAQQFVHPLALLLWAAAALALVAGLATLAIAIVAVIVLNALFAFWREQQAERAVEALGAYLPPHATVVRDGRHCEIEARLLVPGDLLEIAEGQRVSADAQLIAGAVQIDASALTGESQPVDRQAAAGDARLPLLELGQWNRVVDARRGHVEQLLADASGEGRRASEVRVGYPPDELADAAKAADLLVIGSRRWGARADHPRQHR